jgi:hypothetical protein
MPGRAGALLTDIPAFTAFAQDVEDALDGSELRYSQRRELLKRAEHFGIRRFDANLIIAMVQARENSNTDDETLPRSSWCWMAPIIAFAVLQSIIFAAVSWLVLT